jgi:hypothetical protein
MASFSNAVRKIALILVVNILLLELLAFLVVHSLAILRPNLRLDLTIDQYFAKFGDRDLEEYWSGRDAWLGWDRRPFEIKEATNLAGETYVMSYGADGARIDPMRHDVSLISTYGDSFTAGDEVNDDQTWQYYLEQLIGHDVKNYGVPGYGIGQSYLKFQSHLDTGRVTPISMLVIYSNDLKRVVNNFRGYLNLGGPGKLSFKPSYRLLDGEIRFFPIPPLDDSMTLDDLQALAMESSKNDYLMTEERLYFVPQFPYSYQVLKALPKIGKKIHAQFRAVSVDESIWSTQEGDLIANHIIKEFYTAARDGGSIPIVLFIPNVKKWKRGRARPPYYEIRERLKESGHKSPIMIDIYDAEFDESRFSILPFQGHSSPYGNKIIAAHIASKLKELNLVP